MKYWQETLSLSHRLPSELAQLCLQIEFPTSTTYAGQACRSIPGAQQVWWHFTKVVEASGPESQTPRLLEVRTCF